MTFNEQKKWVDLNIVNFPQQFRTDYIWYKNPQFTATNFINLIEARIAHCKSNNLPINKDKVAISTKHNLQRLIDDVKPYLE